jgi:hypothetical protein
LRSPQGRSKVAMEATRLSRSSFETSSKSCALCGRRPFRVKTRRPAARSSRRTSAPNRSRRRAFGAHDVAARSYRLGDSRPASASPSANAWLVADRRSRPPPPRAATMPLPQISLVAARPYQTSIGWPTQRGVATSASLALFQPQAALRRGGSREAGEDAALDVAVEAGADVVAGEQAVVGPALQQGC